MHDYRISPDFIRFMKRDLINLKSLIYYCVVKILAYVIRKSAPRDSRAEPVSQRFEHSSTDSRCVRGYLVALC